MRKLLAPGIAADSDVRFGKPVIAGRRVDVTTIIGHLAAGSSAHEVAEAYELTERQVRDAIAYAARLCEKDAKRQARRVRGPSDQLKPDPR